MRMVGGRERRMPRRTGGPTGHPLALGARCSRCFSTYATVEASRFGSFQPGRTKWHVYPFGYFSR